MTQEKILELTTTATQREIHQIKFKMSHEGSSPMHPRRILTTTNLKALTSRVYHKGRNALRSRDKPRVGEGGNEEVCLSVSVSGSSQQRQRSESPGGVCISGCVARGGAASDGLLACCRTILPNWDSS